MLPAGGKTGAGLDVYVRSGTTTRATLLWGKEDANALLMEVLTPWGKHHVLAAHAPHINIGCEPYVKWVPNGSANSFRSTNPSNYTKWRPTGR